MLTETCEYGSSTGGAALLEAPEHPDRQKQRATRKLNRIERAEVESILDEPTMDYMDHPEFHKPGAKQALFDDAIPLPTPNCDWYHPAMERLEDTRHIKAVTNTLLNAAQEQVIFKQFNFSRYMVAKFQKHLRKNPLRPKRCREMLYWYDHSKYLRDQIVQFNLALVLAMAKHVSSANLDYMELISEGNMALLRAVDKFDAAKGFKFSTYACRAILKGFSRLGVKQTKYKGLFPVAFEVEMERPDPENGQVDHETAEYVDEVKDILKSNAADLTELEKTVLRYRFSLDNAPTDEKMTLSAVGKMVGYTKERVRQIQNRALSKLRQTLEDRFGESPFDE
jgi:RNA polymerase sigma factor (sigma-70 family)